MSKSNNKPNNKSKRIIQIFAIGMAVIFFAGILMGAIGYLSMPKQATQTNNETPSNYTNLNETQTEDAASILKAIDMYKANIDEDPESIPDIIGIAQKYTALAQVYDKAGTAELRDEAYNNSLPFYQMLGEKSADYKVAADYRVAEAYAKLGKSAEAEAKYQELLTSQEGTDPVSIYLTYGGFLRNDLNDEAGAQVYFDKALATAKDDAEKQKIQSLIDGIVSK